jgi:hypothetical protein
MTIADNHQRPPVRDVSSKIDFESKLSSATVSWRGRLRALVAGVRPEDATDRVLRTLATLVPAAPALVGETVSLLVALLEDTESYRDAAAFDVLLALASVDGYAGRERAYRALTVLAVGRRGGRGVTRVDRGRN